MLSYQINHDSEEHRKLIGIFDNLVKFGDDTFAEAKGNFYDNEQKFNALVDEDGPDDEDGPGKEGRSQYKTIHVPMSFAIACTVHTYLSTVFLSRTPVMQVQTRHSKTQEGPMAMEAFLDYNMHVGGNYAPMFMWLMDPLKYGIGVVGTHWDEQEVSTVQFLENPDGSGEVLEMTETVQGYKGNTARNVRPHDFGYDPRRNPATFQEGEFVWELSNDVKFSSLTKETGIEKNVELLEQIRDDSISLREVGGNTYRDLELDNPCMVDDFRSDSLTLREFYLRCIPSELGLGQSTKRTIVQFGVINDSLIVYARPQGNRHGKFPYHMICVEIDAYKALGRSLIDLTDPLEHVQNWLINSHFYNIRKHLNNFAIVNPSLLNMADLRDPEPGGFIRLRPSAYNRNASEAYFQPNIGDVTQGHLKEGDFIERLAQMVTGTNDNILGQVHSGGRKTATEVRTSSSFASNRLKSVAEWMSATGFGPLGRMWIQNAQQYLDDERFMQVVGDLAKGADQSVKVSPESIAGEFDFVHVDGTLPVDPMAQAMQLQQLMMGAMQNPMLQGSYDWQGMFAYVAQLGGSRNFERFKIAQEDQIPQGTMPMQGPQGVSMGGPQGGPMAGVQI